MTHALLCSLILAYSILLESYIYIAYSLYMHIDLCLSFCKMDLRNIPEEVVKETPEYKSLQSQFSLLYNESLGVKTQLDEARALLLTAKNAHLRQIEHMEVSIIRCMNFLYISPV